MSPTTGRSVGPVKRSSVITITVEFVAKWDKDTTPDHIKLVTPENVIMKLRSNSSALLMNNRQNSITLIEDRGKEYSAVFSIDSVIHQIH